MAAARLLRARRASLALAVSLAGIGARATAAASRSRHAAGARAVVVATAVAVRAHLAHGASGQATRASHAAIDFAIHGVGHKTTKDLASLHLLTVRAALKLSTSRSGTVCRTALELHLGRHAALKLALKLATLELLATREAAATATAALRAVVISRATTTAGARCATSLVSEILGHGAVSLLAARARAAVLHAAGRLAVHARLGAPGHVLALGAFLTGLEIRVNKASF